MSEHDRIGKSDVNDEADRRNSNEVVAIDVDSVNPIAPEDNADTTATENVGEESLFQDSLAKASEADYIDEQAEPTEKSSFDDITGLEEAAGYAGSSEADRLSEADSDDPAFAAQQDRADNEYDDEEGLYAMPLTPDSSVDQERPADRAASDEPDVAVEDTGPPCPGVPPPPELFLEQDRDELRTPPLESTLPNVLVSYNRVKHKSLILLR